MRTIILAALCALAVPARAVLPTPEAKGDAQRFGLNRGRERRNTLLKEQIFLARTRFNKRHGGQSPLGILGGPHAGANHPRPGQAALVFLGESKDVLGIDPASLVLEAETSGTGHHHALFHQVYQGVPVEFSRVKVHMDDDGAVTDVVSNLPSFGSLSVTPSISQQAAMAAAARDAGLPTPQAASLVIFPDLYGSNPPRLAWKVTVRGAQELLRYYIDAQNGRVLFRYNDMHAACAGVSGTVTAPVYIVDPGATPAYNEEPMLHERVFVANGNSLVYGDSGSNGSYCASATGKISTQLQGDYVSIANNHSPNAHFDNGGGTWQTASTPFSSPHPYPNSSVLVSTVDLTSLSVGSNVIFAVAPVFTNFNVGGVAPPTSLGSGESGEITDDDMAFVIDPFGNAVGGYVGNKGVFAGAAVPGPVTRVVLQTNSSGQNYGFDVVVSSYLTMPDPGDECNTAMNPACNDVVWSTATNASLPFHSEFSLYYHLNLMHDYFANVMGPTLAQLYLSGSANAQAYAGPGLINAFYNPDTDNLFFGDTCGINGSLGDCFADDATVPHHEYTHYVVEKIWHIQNFGQAGAISEADADYFSASSFSSPPSGYGASAYSVSGVGGYLAGTFSDSSPLREADDAAGVGDLCGSISGQADVLSVNSWQGEIHCDDRFLLQSLWDVRKDAINPSKGNLGTTNGPACVDGLVIQALLFFPESFDEYESALLRADAAGSVAACGGAGAMRTYILSDFSTHGLGSNGNTAGFESAVDVSTMPMVTGAIATPAQVNFYTFAAGPGPMNISITLPPSADGPGLYAGYMMTLFDSNHDIVAQANPIYDGTNTTGLACDSNDCSTSQQNVVLTYNNPSGGQMFLEISGGLVYNSNSAVNTTSPYTLQFVYSPVSAFAGGIVSARYDDDQIGFTVNVTTYVNTQDYYFAWAQLRDQGQNVLTPTQTNSGGSYLQTVSSQNASGQITGTLQMEPGFAARFPDVGTVYLEVFGYNVSGSTVSLGLSNPISLTGDTSDVQAWNNVFNPLTGQQATVKYSVGSSGRLTMRLYTLNGTFIDTLFDGQVAPGEGSVNWNGRNFSNNVVASGIYLLSVQGPGLSKTVKLAVVK